MDDVGEMIPLSIQDDSATASDMMIDSSSDEEENGSSRQGSQGANKGFSISSHPCTCLMHDRVMGS
jgi:hypothetical protein